MKSPSFNAVVSENRKAAFDYFLSDFLEVGIVLKGTEIKAIRKHKVSLRDTYIDFKDGEAFIINLHIPQYEKGNILENILGISASFCTYHRHPNRVGLKSHLHHQQRLVPGMD